MWTFGLVWAQPAAWCRRLFCTFDSGLAAEVVHPTQAKLTQVIVENDQYVIGGQKTRVIVFLVGHVAAIRRQGPAAIRLCVGHIEIKQVATADLGKSRRVTAGLAVHFGTVGPVHSKQNFATIIKTHGVLRADGRCPLGCQRCDCVGVVTVHVGIDITQGGVKGKGLRSGPMCFPTQYPWRSDRQ